MKQAIDTISFDDCVSVTVRSHWRAARHDSKHLFGWSLIRLEFDYNNTLKVTPRGHLDRLFCNLSKATPTHRDIEWQDDAGDERVITEVFEFFDESELQYGVERITQAFNEAAKPSYNLDTPEEPQSMLTIVSHTEPAAYMFVDDDTEYFEEWFDENLKELPKDLRHCIRVVTAYVYLPYHVHACSFEANFEAQECYADRYVVSCEARDLSYHETCEAIEEIDAGILDQVEMDCARPDHEWHMYPKSVMDRSLPWLTRYDFIQKARATIHDEGSPEFVGIDHELDTREDNDEYCKQITWQVIRRTEGAEWWLFRKLLDHTSEWISSGYQNDVFDELAGKATDEAMEKQLQSA